jgi:hypothetical protein
MKRPIGAGLLAYGSMWDDQGEVDRWCTRSSLVTSPPPLLGLDGGRS